MFFLHFGPPKPQNFRLRRYQNRLRNSFLHPLYCNFFAPAAHFPLSITNNTIISKNTFNIARRRRKILLFEGHFIEKIPLQRAKCALKARQKPDTPKSPKMSQTPSSKICVFASDSDAMLGPKMSPNRAKNDPKIEPKWHPWALRGPPGGAMEPPNCPHVDLAAILVRKMTLK